MKQNDIASYITTKLLEQGFIVHRYDSYTTISIYLKLDYGLMHSIRISDHKGKKHLSYKYNIEKGLNVAKWFKDNNGFWRYKCPATKKEIDKLIDMIVEDKFFKVISYKGTYNQVMEEYKNKSANEKGFWQQAREITLDMKGELYADKTNSKN